MPVTVAGAALIALAGCSGGEEPEAVETPGEVMPPAIASTAEALEPVVEEEPEMVATPAVIEEPSSVATIPPLSGEAKLSEGSAGGPVLLTLPWADFPDNVALLARFSQEPYTSELVRIYKDRDGEPVRERIFSYPRRSCEGASSVDYDGIQTLAGHLPDCISGHFTGLDARPDASSLVMTVCVEQHCDGVVGPEYPRGRTAIYESRDGGVTWQKLTTFDRPWYVTQVLQGDGDGNTRLVLELWNYHLVDTEQEGRVEGRTTYMLWPSGEEFSQVAALEAALTEDYVDDGIGYPLSLGDGRLLLPWHWVEYQPEELIGPQGAAMGWVAGNAPQNWPTIRDPETGEQWPIRLPYDVLSLGDFFPRHIAVQRGPFLRVVDVGDCLPVVAAPSLDAGELACAAERVLLTDLGEVSEVDGTTWHRVRTPSGIEGWADGRWLE